MSAHVVVGLSGGVDSAVSALLQQQQGCRVSAVFMQNWAEDEDGYCSAAEDFQEARRVAEELDIPLHRVDFSDEYRERVFADFLSAYRAGRTPNPDVLCNREIKFAPFVEHARRLGADGVATGHYARLRDTDDGPQLRRAADDNKDQTYFLCQVPRASLRGVCFPIGEMDKSAVRERARQAGLPNHRRRDSTGICFIGERDFREFLGTHLPDAPGDIVDEHGGRLGEHQGLHHYTLGQRRGLRLGGRRGAEEAPWYVIGKCHQSRRLTVSQDPRHPALMCVELDCEGFNWLGEPGGGPLTARLRHRQPLQACRLLSVDGGRVRLAFETPQRAVVPGQYAALYRDDHCLGGGEIVDTRTLSDTV